MWVAGKGTDVSVISVEPHPFHNSLLEKTLNLPVNAELAKRVQLHKVALSTSEDAGNTVCMKVHPTNAAMTFVDKGKNSNENGNLPCTHVPVTTLDSILGSTKIDVMKIDVEGYEFKVFGGSETTLLANPPKLIVMEYNVGRGATCVYQLSFLMLFALVFHAQGAPQQTSGRMARGNV